MTTLSSIHSPAQSTQELSVQEVSVSYGNTTIVKDINFTLKMGEIGCFLGPSGCGKSTLLRAIAGFENLSQGRIVLDSEMLSTSNAVVAPEKRCMGMVFQDIALFPHLTVRENIEFGIRSWSKKQKQERVSYLLGLVNLTGFENRYPDSLSGGQQQRIALIRAIAPKPKLLLMDEPFSGLDAKLREELVPDVRNILLHENIRAILVTHDQMEAFAMADHIAILNQGQVHQSASAYMIYHNPATRFVAEFIGYGDFLPAKVCDEFKVKSDLGTVGSEKKHGFNVGDEVDLLIRPDDVLHDDDSEFVGLIVSRWFRGSHFLYRVKLQSGKIIYCFASSHHDHSVGQTIGLRVNLDHLVLFEKKE
ncbi:ABC transporter ATP-binding protein [Marinomonas agarivorans]|nr:ABC transporter ATP-binding protein [Marinomonas agarivorans]